MATELIPDKLKAQYHGRAAKPGSGGIKHEKEESMNMKYKAKSPNAKNPDFGPPMNLSGVSPEEYSTDIDSGRGSAASRTRRNRLGSGPPDYTEPGYPSGRETAKPRK